MTKMQKYLNQIKEIKTYSKPRLIDLFGKLMFGTLAIFSSVIVVYIFYFLWIEAVPAFIHQPSLILDLTWNPYFDQYGIFIFVAGTLWVSGLAIIIAVPIGLCAAIFLAEYCPLKIEPIFKTIIQLMASIPSIVYGLWGFRIMVPILKNNIQPTLQQIFWWNPLFVGKPIGYGVMAGSIILAVMLLPTIVAISLDAMKFVPASLKEASYGLGATRTETTFRVVLSTALPGISAAILLALGRAVGETMAVLMVTGNTLNIPMSFFDPVYVITSLIANQLGFAYNTPIYRSSLFAAALVLLIISIAFTLISKSIIKWGMKRQGAVSR
ncbi:MAG: phosphate ABC transporter permease subunit PstC [Candidatus Ranarchaeia archaeon]